MRFSGPSRLTKTERNRCISLLHQTALEKPLERLGIAVNSILATVSTAQISLNPKNQTLGDAVAMIAQPRWFAKRRITRFQC
jgi:hypothetical protein